jgi:hypothetical protein
MFARELLCSFELPAGDAGQFGARRQLDHGRHAICNPAGADDSPTQWPIHILSLARRLRGKYGRDRGCNCAGTDNFQEPAASSVNPPRIVMFAVLAGHTSLRQWRHQLLTSTRATLQA